jgi:hypothetical protein
VDDVLPLALRPGLSLKQPTLLEDDCDSSDEDLDGDLASPVTGVGSEDEASDENVTVLRDSKIDETVPAVNWLENWTSELLRAEQENDADVSVVTN